MISVPVRGRPAASARPPFTRALVSLEACLSAAAFGGAAWLISHPADAIPGTATTRLPLPNWAWGGVLLALTVALPAAAAAAGALAGRAWSHPAHPVVGLALMGWIVVQVAVLGPSTWLQPAMFAWGAVILALGARHYRAWHSGWGATELERSAPLPGDDLLPRPHFCATRAVTIDAPPQEVWPWIVQLGFGRAGWYSYDLLDNLGRRSARSIEPRWQSVGRGDPVPMSASDDPRTVFRVREARPPGLLLWTKPDSTWVWLLRPDPAGGTRLVTRLRARYQGPAAPLAAALLELGDFPMMRRCLLGIRQRAQQAARGTVTR